MQRRSTVTRVLVVSDTHLSSRTPEAVDNWSAVVRYAAGRKPALVVHTGDITADGADRDDDLELARDELGRLGAPTRVVPGNHDIGETPGLRSPEVVVSPARLARYRGAIGLDRWRVDVPGWRLLGVNGLLLGSGMADEGDQWRWLDDEVAGLDELAQPTLLALFLHKPLRPTPVVPDDATPTRYVPPAARDRLLDLLGGVPGSLVVSGHCHQFSSEVHDGLTSVWAPSTWAVIPDRVQPCLGAKVCGVVELRLAADGDLRIQLIQPAGMRQHTLGETVAHPDAGP